MLLYKYRSLDNFRNFVDILLNNRIYAAPYFDLNDPMEGLYIYNDGEINKELLREIKNEKTKLRICSLSRTPRSTLMWSHYANGHKGVAIGVKVGEEHEAHKVNYGGLSFVQHAQRNGGQETAKRILTHKLEAWHYEEEERVFVTNGVFASVQIKEVVLGSNISNEDRDLVKDLVYKLNPDIILKDSTVEEIV